LGEDDSTSSESEDDCEYKGLKDLKPSTEGNGLLLDFGEELFNYCGRTTGHRYVSFYPQFNLFSKIVSYIQKVTRMFLFNNRAGRHIKFAGKLKRNEELDKMALEESMNETLKKTEEQIKLKKTNCKQLANAIRASSPVYRELENELERELNRKKLFSKYKRAAIKFDYNNMNTDRDSAQSSDNHIKEITLPKRKSKGKKSKKRKLSVITDDLIANEIQILFLGKKPSEVENNKKYHIE